MVTEADRAQFCQAEGCLDLWETTRVQILLCLRHASNVDRVMAAHNVTLDQLAALMGGTSDQADEWLRLQR